MPNHQQISIHAVQFHAENLQNYWRNFAIGIYKFSASSDCSPCCLLSAGYTKYNPYLYRQHTRLEFPNCLHLIKLSLSAKQLDTFHWLNPLLQFAWLIVVSVSLNNWNNTERYFRFKIEVKSLWISCYCNTIWNNEYVIRRRRTLRHLQKLSVYNLCIFGT